MEKDAPTVATSALAATPTTPAAPVKKHHGCLAWLLVVFIVFGLFVFTILGIFLAYRGGYINQVYIKNALGIGYGEVSVVNILDDAMSVTITPLTTDPDNLSNDQLAIDRYGISSFRGLDQGRYTLDFADVSGTDLGTCTLAITSGDQYQFVAVPNGVAVTRASAQPNTPADLNMSTSALCQQ